MRKVDLHVHSNYSDGSDSIDELIENDVQEPETKPEAPMPSSPLE